MKIQSIDTEIIKAYFHAGQPDTPQKSAQEMKDFFDAMPKKVLIPKLNEVIDELNSGGYGKSAYEIACEQGFDGSKAEWLASLKGETGDTGAKGDTGDAAVIKRESASDISDVGVYLVKGEYLLASPDSWDTDITKPVTYTGTVAEVDKLGLNSDDSAIPYANQIPNKESLWGFPLLKYKNTSGDGTGGTYLILRWDFETLYAYSSDGEYIAPYYVDEYDLLSENVDFSGIVNGQGVYGKGEDICGNFALISKFFKSGIKIERLVSDESKFSNALKGKKSGTQVVLDDVSPISHTLSVTAEDNATVTRYGGNLFDGTLRACIIQNNTFSDYDNAVVNSELYQSLKIYLPAGTYSINSTVPINIVRRVLDGNYMQYSKINTYHDTFTLTEAGYVGFTFRRTDGTRWDFADKIWINAGTVPTEYQDYVSPVEFNAKDGVGAIYPCTTLICEKEITAEYNRDINKVIAKLGG